MIARIGSALLLLISSVFAVNASDIAGADQGRVWVDPGWRRTVSRYNITFDEQGLSTTVFEFEITALDEKGAEAISQQAIAYNSYFSELICNDLATLKTDGSVITVDQRAIRDQPASTDTSSPYFDEQRQRIVAYSHVAPGDKVRGRLTYKTKRPEFAGEFARYWSQPADQPPELGSERNEKLAAQWYAKAAEQGDIYSQACLATMYRDGRGLAQDFQQAASWYTKAADQGYAWAEMNLGLLYAEGKGVPLDYTKSLFFLRNAADRDDSYAQYNLGWPTRAAKAFPRIHRQPSNGIARRPMAAIRSPKPACRG